MSATPTPAPEVQTFHQTHQLIFEKKPPATTTESTPMAKLHSPDEIRREIKRVEQEIDHKLSTYSNFSDRIEQWTFDVEDSGLSNSLEISPLSSLDDVELLLDKLTELNKALNDSNTSVNISQHHRSRLDDYTREFRRLRNAATSAWERAQLVRGKKKYESLPDRSVNMDNLMRERSSIHSSSVMANDLVLQAEETKSQLDRQLDRLSSINSRIRGVGRNMPSLNTIMSNIRYKKNRNMLILAGVISFCICFLLWWWWSS
mmetsp:Transcript_22352/g.31160  ORF Transcript_22352/g.31160 Transcript_22352/m.31160 type:complete len:260 (-) Transcript_22352:10-789(-)